MTERDYSDQKSTVKVLGRKPYIPPHPRGLPKNATQIIDLDGCISDDRSRRRLIRISDDCPSEWFRAYHAVCTDDACMNQSEVRLECRIVVITARPSQKAVRHDTESWLRYHGINVFALIMRNNFDYRPSVEVKQSAAKWMLDYYGVATEDVIDAIDDRQDVVDMYAKVFGFPSRLVKIGDGESSL